MDEPLSNLDAKLRGYMRAELKHMQHELGVTTIYVTHDQVEAMTLAHRVAVMDHGVLQQIGTPREVYDRPANLFVAGFMGSPPMNFVRGRIESGRFEGHGVSLPLDGGAAGGDAVLGFRPEDAEIVDPGTGPVRRHGVRRRADRRRHPGDARRSARRQPGGQDAQGVRRSTSTAASRCASRSSAASCSTPRSGARLPARFAGAAAPKA